MGEWRKQRTSIRAENGWVLARNVKPMQVSNPASPTNLTEWRNVKTLIIGGMTPDLGCVSQSENDAIKLPEESQARRVMDLPHAGSNPASVTN